MLKIRKLYVLWLINNLQYQHVTTFIWKLYHYTSKYFYKAFGGILFFIAHFGYSQPCTSKEVLIKSLKESIINNKRGSQLNNLQHYNYQFVKCNYANDSSYIKLLKALISSYIFIDKPDSAYKLINKAIILNSTKSNKFSQKDFADLYYYLGLLEYTSKFDYNSSLKSLTNSIYFGEKSKSFEGKWKYAYDLQSRIYHRYGDYWHSMDNDKKTESIARLENDTLTLAQSIAHQALNYTDLGNLNSAETMLIEAIKIARELGNDFYDLASYYHRLADIQRKINQLDKSLINYKNAITIYQLHKDEQGVAESNASIGVLYSDYIKNYPRAGHFYKVALSIAKEPYLKMRILTQIGKSYKSRKLFAKSLSSYEWGINIIREHLRASQLTAKSIQKAAFKEYLLTLIQDKADTWLDYYKATNTKSHLTNALKTYALADSMIDFMRYEHVGEGSKLFWRQKTRGMYERAIEASYLAGDTEAAFRFFEKSKAVLLSDKLNELGANQQLTESSAKRQRTLRDSIANLQNQLASLPANDAKRSGIQRRLEQFNDDFEAFRKQLESTNPAYYRYKYDNSTPTIAEFQKSISTNGSGSRTVGFVSYFVGDSAIYAFCLDQKARLVRLSLRPSDYQSLANEFLSLCADRSHLNAHYPQYRALAHRLYQLLWKPLGMIASRVIISQDGVFLPFETLLVQPNQNDFLLKHHAISYTYSANFLAKNQTDLAPSLHQGDKLFHRSFVGFAPETFQPSLRQASLKGSVAALEAVEEKFWWGKTLKNNEATKAQFMRYAPNSRVIQLFTHADADSTEAIEPRIYFHDAALRLSELTQADRFAAQLLVLSACKTGVGQNQRGEGVFSLARGFAALGIPSTITTLWSVEDQPTYELTKLFYNYLDQGLPKDEALQRAKLDWLNQGDAADALPSQWAGMILVGDTAPLAMDGLRFIVLGLGLLGLGVLGGVWWWRKHASFSSTTKMSRFYNHSKKG